MLLTKEMDRQGLRDLHRREAVIRDGVEIHIETKVRTEPRFTYDGVNIINKCNNAIEGNVERRHPYFYWRTERARLATPLNEYGPWQDESCFRISHILAPSWGPSQISAKTKTTTPHKAPGLQPAPKGEAVPQPISGLPPKWPR